MSFSAKLSTTHLFLFFVVAVSSGVLAQRHKAESRATLTVLSYNIKHGYGMDGRVDLSRSAALIKRLNPDLVALQEIDKATERTKRVDQAKALGHMTRMHANFGRFFDFQGGEYGMAILSKNKPSDARNHRLPDGREPRTSLAITVIPVENGPEIVFVGIHFYATAEERLAQAEKLLEILKSETRPVILAGDFNSRPGSDVMKLFADGWTIPDKGEDRLTIPSDKPRSEIDFIIFRGLEGWELKKIDVLEEPLISDHRPVLLELYMPQK
ncbi:MAG: endonuclease/exonuclease/phosphatase family protein [Pirellulales bacterium]|nr:endonuclease/exonuclease/phosphatase family protein [Pirellulales bacterium]